MARDWTDGVSEACGRETRRERSEEGGGKPPGLGARGGAILRGCVVCGALASCVHIRGSDGLGHLFDGGRFVRSSARTADNHRDAVASLIHPSPPLAARMRSRCGFHCVWYCAVRTCRRGRYLRSRAASRVRSSRDGGRGSGREGEGEREGGKELGREGAYSCTSCSRTALDGAAVCRKVSKRS
jgi:hypothetical protein